MFDLIGTAYAMGQAPQGAEQAGGIQGMLMNLAPLIVIFVIFYFLLIRPQKKKATEFKQLLEGLKKGDKIVTAGGIYGVIESVSANTIVVKIAENTKVKLNKNSVATVVTQETEE